MSAPAEAGPATYVYRPPTSMSYDQAVEKLVSRGTHPVVRGPVNNASPSVLARIRSLAAESDMGLHDYVVDGDRFRAYVRDAGYEKRYATYYTGNRHEKALEHFIAAELLGLGWADIFVDLASEDSPVPEIFGRLAGCVAYRQDIMYPPGVAGDRIGGDACAMPVAGPFFTKAALTCSLEHFEGEADLALFRELYRVLEVGGKVVVIPFYLFEADATQTDPTVSVGADVSFDPGCTLYCAPGWGNRHGRFYSPASFTRRVVAPLAGKMSFDCYQIVNASEVHPSVYARFAFVATKL